MVWEISVAGIALALVVLIIFLIKALMTAERTMVKSAQALQEVQKKVDELSIDIRQFVKQAKDITSDLQLKMKQIDPILESVKNTGDLINEVSSITKQATSLIGRIKQPQGGSSSRRISPPNPSSSDSSPDAPNDPSRQQGSDQPEQAADLEAGWMKWMDMAARLWQKYRS